MVTEDPTRRSRRAILAAAAGAAGALAASAALPLTAAAAPANMLTEQDNLTTATTSVTDSGADSTALAGHATGAGYGYGLEGTSVGGGGVVGWSVSPPAAFTPDDVAYVGVFGSAPVHPDPDPAVSAVGVWGYSPDIGVAGTGGTGVYGSGEAGVYGAGGVGVVGEADPVAGNVGMWAYAPTTAQTALKVSGKVSFSRSGRKAMRRGTKTKAVALAGVTATSKVFAVLATTEAGRWVRAVVPASGKFTIYLNTTLTSSAVVSWFVLD